MFPWRSRTSRSVFRPLQKSWCTLLASSKSNHPGGGPVQDWSTVDPGIGGAKSVARLWKPWLISQCRVEPSWAR